MDLLWVLHAPFWQKMYFICVAIGYALFLNFVIDILRDAKKDFKVWKKNYFENEFPKVMKEHHRIVREMKQKIFGKAMCLMLMGRHSGKHENL
jgi:hypothetical protein